MYSKANWTECDTSGHSTYVYATSTMPRGHEDAILMYMFWSMYLQTTFNLSTTLLSAVKCYNA